MKHNDVLQTVNFKYNDITFAFLHSTRIDILSKVTERQSSMYGHHQYHQYLAPLNTSYKLLGISTCKHKITQVTLLWLDSCHEFNSKHKIQK